MTVKHSAPRAQCHLDSACHSDSLPWGWSRLSNHYQITFASPSNPFSLFPHLLTFSFFPLPLNSSSSSFYDVPFGSSSTATIPTESYGYRSPCPPLPQIPATATTPRATSYLHNNSLHLERKSVHHLWIPNLDPPPPFLPRT